MAVTLGSVSNPPSPYQASIPGGLSTGKQIFVQGIIPISVDVFGINFKCGSAPNADIAFHFNPRFKENCVVRNALQNGAWGPEERHGSLPLNKEYPFELIFLAQDSHFKVAVNGQHFTEFQHRIPLHRVDTFEIGKGPRISFVRFEGPPMPAPPPPMPYPGGAYNMQPMYNLPTPPPPMPYSGGAYGMQPMYNPPVPLTTAIPGGLYPGKMIFISGLPQSSGGFSFNIKNGSGGGDIAFHFNVRIQYGNDRNQVVRNHFSNGQWGNEERSISHFPFYPNASFDVIILCEAACFKVAVNNQHFVEFRHRLQPFAKFDMFSIQGDVRITQVRFQ